jgi:hypothetical protein
MRSEGESSPVVRERGGETANIIIRQEDMWERERR